jgi:hypothetical protein
MRARDRKVVFEIGKERNCLECFPETLEIEISCVFLNGGIDGHHFVRENTVQAVMMERYHPVETLQLIPTHLPVDDWRGCIRCIWHSTERRR